MTPAEPIPDAAQRAVVALPAAAEGVVIGAAGTGKTHALLERVERLIEAGECAADEVLILTPSRQTATRLRDVIGLRVGSATPGALARSLGSLAFQIVRAAMVRAGRPAPQLLTGADQDRIVAELLHGDEADAADGTARWPEELPAAARNATAFRSELRSLMDECTELALTPAELADLGDRTDHPVWSAAGSFLADYRHVLGRMRSEHRDAADLLAEAARVLRETPAELAAATLGPVARLRAVMIDDAQELTRGAIELVSALRSRGVAVLAFGDPDIGSGAFRGVTPELFARLAGLLGEVHVLDGPHRSAAAIARLARTVTQAIGAGGRVDHRRDPGPEVSDARVEALIAASPFEEVDAIARRLRTWHVLAGVPWSAMAVIAHDTRQVAALETELAAREVPTRAAGVQRPLGRENVVRDLLQIIALAVQEPAERDPELIANALLSPFGGLDAVGLRRLRAALRHRELGAAGTATAADLLRSGFAHPLELGMLDVPEARPAERLATTFGRVAEAHRRGETIHELLWLVWDRSRSGGRSLADAWRETATAPGPAAAEASRALDALVALFEAAKRAVERGTDADPDSFIRNLLDSDVPEDTLAAPERVDTVTLMTPATALGAEFDAVVIAGVQDGVWPNVRLRGGLLDSWMLADTVEADRVGRVAEPAAVLDRRRAALHDELRLFVRAVSRARTRLLVTAVDDDDLGPSALFAFLPEPTRPDEDLAAHHPLTLRGLVARHRRTLTGAHVPDERRIEAAGQLGALAEAGVPGASPEEWYGVMAPSSDAPLRDPQRSPIPVSPSRMTGFEDCGVDWAIRALGGDTRTWSSGLGTILHAAMEDVPGGALDELQAVVDARWGELDFEAPWQSAKERRWAALLVERLHRYLLAFRQSGALRVGAEAEFTLAIPLDEHSGAEDVLVVPPDGSGLDPDVPYALLRGAIDRVEVYPPGEMPAELAVPATPDRPAARRAIVVDLKTGRSEARVADDKVDGDAQLAAYQLAVASGAVPGADPADAAGARLLVLSKALKNTHWRVAHQAPLGPEGADAFVQRVIADATGMASASFDANIDSHCRIDRFAICGIHTVKAVSAS
ncbi:ATP-dependent DNA helicase [Microbacterium gorillae]|uniref:ATP-dependent DNA helicase n=1 Tax=Microbacterium gorillae TaxID=1231063 RepID=UPI00058CA051|nr:ATP-dependent DNA helicase [Microbacterium gorillae]